MLCGFIGTGDPSLLAGMEEDLSHRVRNGWTRLSTEEISLSWGHEVSGQPLCGARAEKGVVLALVGMPRHPRLKSFSALFSEVLKRGEACLSEIGGAYVGFYSENGKHRLLRDPAGKRTLYHLKSGGMHFFSSETRTLYRLPSYSPALCASSIAQYLSFSYTPGSQSMLEGIHELPPGSWWDLSRATPERFFKPESLVSSMPDDEEYWITEFHKRYEEALKKVELPIQEKALFLSGGIDSSLVAASLAENYGGENISAFAIHFGKDYPNELVYARKAASHVNIKCEEVEIMPKDFVPILSEMVERLNDPIGDPVTMPNYLLAQHVSQQGFRAVYNGEGGDPLFGGPKNMTMLLHHWYGGSKEKNHQEKAYLASYRRGYEERRLLLTPDWLKRIDDERELEGVLTPFFTSSVPESYLKRLLMINIRLKGAHLILPKVERMLGAHGVVPLSPLYDEELIKLSMELPSALLLKNGSEKQILKRAYATRLPQEILHRPKSGMRVPVHYWFKGEMRKYARHILLDKRVKNAGIFNQKRLKQLLNYDTEEAMGRYGIRLWMLLTFELWRRDVFKD